MSCKVCKSVGERLKWENWKKRNDTLTSIKSVFFQKVDKIFGKGISICFARSNIGEHGLSGCRVVRERLPAYGYKDFNIIRIRIKRPKARCLVKKRTGHIRLHNGNLV